MFPFILSDLSWQKKKKASVCFFVCSELWNQDKNVSKATHYHTQPHTFMQDGIEISKFDLS